MTKKYFNYVYDYLFFTLLFLNIFSGHKSLAWLKSAGTIPLKN